MRADEETELVLSLSADVEDAAVPPGERTVVEMRGIRKSFGDVEVLRGVDLTVAAGEHVVIFGPSGSGKSTLLRTINLLERPSAGSLRVLGREYGDGTDAPRGKPVRAACVSSSLGLCSISPSEVSGVRSSCDAVLTNVRRDCSWAASLRCIVANARARSPTSSRWLTRVTSWSMIGPASSSSVT